MKSVTLVYIISQIFTLAMYSFLGVSYHVKTKHRIVLFHELAMLANAVAYFLLGAWSGLAMCLIALVRNLYLLWDEQKRGTNVPITVQDKIFLIIIYSVIALAAFCTYKGVWSLLSVLAFALQTFSVWQKRPIVYKALGMPITILYLGYNLYVRSLFGVILEAVMFVVATIGYIRAKREKI